MNHCLSAHTGTVSYKMIFFHIHFVMHTTANIDKTYRISVFAAIWSCISGDADTGICLCHKSAAFCHFFRCLFADRRILFQS